MSRRRTFNLQFEAAARIRCAGLVDMLRTGFHYDTPFRLPYKNNPLEKAKHFRDQADKLRSMAGSENNEKARRDVLVLTNQYDGLSLELLKRVG